MEKTIETVFSTRTTLRRCGGTCIVIIGGRGRRWTCAWFSLSPLPSFLLVCAFGDIWFNIVLIIKVDALSPYLVSINLYFKVNIILRGTTTVRRSSV